MAPVQLPPDKEEVVKKELIVKCVCSCTAAFFTKYSDEEDYYLQFMTSFNPNSNFLTRVKQAFKVLRGDYNNVFGLVITQEDMNKIRQF